MRHFTTEKCLDYRDSDNPKEALRDYGKYAEVLLSKVGCCYDVKTQSWNDTNLGLLRASLDETVEQIKKLHTVAYGDTTVNDDKDWKPLRGKLHKFGI